MCVCVLTMSESDILSESSDSELSPPNCAFFGQDSGLGPTSSQAVSRSSSPFDYYDEKVKAIFNKNVGIDTADGSSVEDFLQSMDKTTKVHDISSSDEDINSDNRFKVESAFEFNSSGSLSSHISSDTTSQLFALTQSKGECKAAKAAEREQKRMEKEAAKAEKQREKEERTRLREERNRNKLAEKREKLQMRYKRNQMKPGECIKYMTVVLDEKLFRTVLCSKAVEAFPHSEVKFNFKELPVENSIIWTRTELDGSENEEDWSAVMWPAENVAKAIEESTLVSCFNHITSSVYPGKHVVLLIFAMEHYHRKSQNARSSQGRRGIQQRNENINSQSDGPAQSPHYLTREEIEMGLVELQILAGVCHRHFNDSQEFADILGQFTRAIAEIPYKRIREEVDKEIGWFAKSSNKNCVKVNKDMQGLDRLWLQQLSVFNNATVDTAKAITAIYPTPVALFQAYDSCSNQMEKELLLQNIQVKRSGCSSAVYRRLGPELSKKICLTFTLMDGDIKLSSKTK